MGMYDTVHVPCPTCGEKQGFQTKSGPCELREYELDEAPADVIINVNRHGPATCAVCNTRFEVEFDIKSFDAKSVVSKAAKS